MSDDARPSQYPGSTRIIQTSYLGAEAWCDIDAMMKTTPEIVRAVTEKLQWSLRRHEYKMWSDLIGPSNPYPMASGYAPICAADPDYRLRGTANDPNFAFTKEGKNMANPSLSLYEVYVTDRRVADDYDGVHVLQVRAANEDDAKLKTVLRLDFAESDIAYLDFGIQRRIGYVQDIDAAE